MLPPQKWRKKNSKSICMIWCILFCLRHPYKVRRPISAKQGGTARVHFKSAPEWHTSRYIDLPFYLFSFLSSSLLFPFLFLFFSFLSLPSFPFLFLLFWHSISDPGVPWPLKPPRICPCSKGFMYECLGAGQTVGLNPSFRRTCVYVLAMKGIGTERIRKLVWLIISVYN